VLRASLFGILSLDRETFVLCASLFGIVFLLSRNLLDFVRGISNLVGSKKRLRQVHS
jgi:hypothetical protein